MINHAGRSPTPDALGYAALILAALLVMVLAADGVAFANQTWIGVHGGPGMPSIEGGTTEQSKGYTSRCGPYFGVFVEHSIGPNLSLRADVNYASQGGKRNGMQPIMADQLPGMELDPGMMVYADFHNETILDYIEIPVMAKMTWGRTRHFFVDAGPYIGILVRAKTVTRGSSLLYIDGEAQPLPPVSFDADTNIREDINSTNAGIAAGAGLETPLGPGNIVFSARFSTGLTNIQKHPDEDGRNRTGAVVVTLGYAYPLPGKR